MPHPPSRYARVVVWAVVAIWLETYCWLVANTYWLCLAMPGAFVWMAEDNFQLRKLSSPARVSDFHEEIYEVNYVTMVYYGPICPIYE